MTSDVYYPEQRHLLPLSLIRRERLLPDGIQGEIETAPGARVAMRDVIARAIAPAPYVILDAVAALRLRNADALTALLWVVEGDTVAVDQVLAGKSKGRGKRLLSPINGTVVSIANGRIILQEFPESINLEAGLNGQVVAISRGRGAVIETYGAVAQGVWGNHKRAVGTLRSEPDEGLESIYRNVIETQYRGVIVVTKRPLTAISLRVMEDQGLSGIIAPSMVPELIEHALRAPGPIMLTEGFGTQRMSSTRFQFLDDFDGYQALLDATMPAPLETRRPEAIINVPLRTGERPRPANLDQVLQEGMIVLLARGDQAGTVGQIVRLPKTPVVLDNGLRVACAEVELITGETMNVPLANLEISGQ